MVVVNEKFSPPVTILTGPRGDGKSTFCRSLAQHRGVAGVVSLGCVDHKDRRYGLDAFIAPTGEQFPLARVTDPDMDRRRASERAGRGYALATPPPGEELSPAESADGITVGPYLFSISALTRVVDALRGSAGDPATRLIVVDEIGPLEVTQSRGLFEVLRELLQGTTEMPRLPLVLVVRPSLVVPVSRMVQELRPGATPETIGVRDFDDPADARTLESLV